MTFFRNQKLSIFQTNENTSYDYQYENIIMNDWSYNTIERTVSVTEIKTNTLYKNKECEYFDWTTNEEEKFTKYTDLNQLVDDILKNVEFGDADSINSNSVSVDSINSNFIHKKIPNISQAQDATITETANKNFIKKSSRVKGKLNNKNKIHDLLNKVWNDFNLNSSIETEAMEILENNDNDKYLKSKNKIAKVAQAILLAIKKFEQKKSNYLESGHLYLDNQNIMKRMKTKYNLKQAFNRQYKDLARNQDIHNNREFIISLYVTEIIEKLKTNEDIKINDNVKDKWDEIAMQLLKNEYLGGSKAVTIAAAAVNMALNCDHNDKLTGHIAKVANTNKCTIENACNRIHESSQTDDTIE